MPQLLMVLLSVVLVPLLLLLLSIDSPFYEIWGRVDSSWFFTAGKAWMEGMVPYVDFSDSKGPLLWLIYGVGYLLSNNDFVGVWILTCVGYLVTFWFIYGISRVFVDSRCLSFLVAVLMLWVYFNPVVHYETKSEDFCQPFIAMSMWSVCRVLYCRPVSHSALASMLRCGAWLTGISIGATLLIKFTLAVMIVFFALILCFGAWRSRALSVGGVTWRVGAGVAIVCLPFVIWFACLGNLEDFVNEYFVFTAKISSHSPRLNVVGWLLGGGFLSGLMVVMSLSTGAVFLMARRHAWVPLVAFGWFLVITVQNAEWVYYYNGCLIFAVFGLVALAALLSKLSRSKVLKVALSVIALAGTGWASLSHASGLANFKFADHRGDPLRAMGGEFYRHVDVVGRVKQPRIVFFNYNNKVNVADATGGLPGCKYWAKQYGAKGMQEVQFGQIKKKKPHFIYVKKGDFKSRERVESLGYFCLLQPGEFYEAYLYVSPQLKTLYPEY